MATTVHNPPNNPSVKSSAGRKSGGHKLPTDADVRALLSPSAEPARTGVWVALASITMIFAALTSALFVREGASTDWPHITLPPILFINTLLLIASSIALEVARRKVAAFARGIDHEVATSLLWLFITLALGLLFVTGQYRAWLGLRAQGLYLASNPNSSFFYVLTAVHAVHVIGGLGGLLYVINKLWRPVLALRRSTLDSASYYWHFMGILWLYLLFVIWIKL